MSFAIVETKSFAVYSCTGKFRQIVPNVFPVNIYEFEMLQKNSTRTELKVTLLEGGKLL